MTSKEKLIRVALELTEEECKDTLELLKYSITLKDKLKQAITTCLKPSGFDLQSFKEILGID
jgi:hypothetical protein